MPSGHDAIFAARKQSGPQTTGGTRANVATLQSAGFASRSGRDFLPSGVLVMRNPEVLLEFNEIFGVGRSAAAMDSSAWPSPIPSAFGSPRKSALKKPLH